MPTILTATVAKNNAPVAKAAFLSFSLA